MEESHITVNGYKIRYLEAGNSSERLVLLHGLGASADRWRSAIPHLSKRYHLIVPDIIGYGQSDKPSVDYTPQFFTKFTFDFLDCLGIRKTCMAGASLGGQILAECAATQSPIIQKIILISPAGIMKKSTPALDAYTTAALYPNKESVKTAYEMMAGNNRQINEQTVETFIQNMSRPNAKMVFLSTLLGLRNSPIISEKLQMIKTPTLLIWGEKDILIPLEYANQFTSSIKNCQFVVMKGCGHVPYAEEPEEFSKIVIKFLSQ